MTGRTRTLMLAGYVVLAGTAVALRPEPVAAQTMETCYASWYTCTVELSKTECGGQAYCDNDHPGCNGWAFENC